MPTVLCGLEFFLLTHILRVSLAFLLASLKLHPLEGFKKGANDGDSLDGGTAKYSMARSH